MVNTDDVGFGDLENILSSLSGIVTIPDNFRVSIKEHITKLRDRDNQQQTELNFWRAYPAIFLHDISAPLNIIVGYAGMIGVIEKEKQPAVLERISAEGEKMKTYAQEATYLAEVVIKDRIQVEEVSLSHIAKEIISELKERDKGQRTNFRVADNVTTYGDSILLRLMMRNLLSNAYKYSQENPHPIIEFGTEQQDGNVVYYVKDNGIGFQQSEASELFKPFKRMGNAQSISGSGVGLFIVNTIIDKHKGIITPKGEVNNGATFYFTLPKPQS
ncbi:HAMP domain-containing histidine kinase [Candidatus Woesearchaeota archaeon]|nr:HAMP domain-containing histidine kinase [Candidatus Woesearchaeota archaeon]